MIRKKNMVLSKNEDEVSLERVSSSTLSLARKIHIHIFPIIYPSFFYNQLLMSPSKDCYLIKLKKVIGVVSFSYEPKGVYLMTFGLVRKYRYQGLGGKALRLFEEKIKSLNYFIISLHVQVRNMQACLFYLKNGYKIVAKDEQYYQSLKDKAAYMFVKRLMVEGNQ